MAGRERSKLTIPPQDRGGPGAAETTRGKDGEGATREMEEEPRMEEEVVLEEGEEDRKESLMEWIDRQLEEAERKTSGSPWPEEAGGEGGSGPGNKVTRSDSASKVAERSDTKSHDSTETDSEIEATTDSEIELLESPRGRGGEGRLLEDSDSEEEQKDKGGEDKDGAWTSSDPTGNPENNSWRVKLAREEENR